MNVLKNIAKVIEWFSYVVTVLMAMVAIAWLVAEAVQCVEVLL